jgi:hypothetical protein
LTIEDLIKIASTYGFPTAIALFLYLEKQKAKIEEKPSGVIISKLDAIEKKVDKLEDVPVRLAIVETKIEGLK